MAQAASTEANPVSYRFGAWLPVGRTPRPHDMPPESLDFRRALVKTIIDWGLVVALVGIAIIQLVPVVENLLRENMVFPLPYFVRAIAPLVLLEEYRRFCWSAQRLHDLGRSVRPYVVRRIPVWALLATIGVVNETLFFGSLPAGLLSSSILWGILLILTILVLPMMAIIAGFWLHSHVYRPFNDYLLGTPGDPGQNRFGPPPPTIGTMGHV